MSTFAKNFLFSMVCFLSMSVVAQAQTVVGKWRTTDDATGKPKSIVEITNNNGKYTGKVIQLLDPERAKANPKCEKCSDDRKNTPIVGLEIIRDMKADGSEFSGGTILDPENGKIYTSKMWLEGADVLKVRGYVGFFFRTQTWNRVK